MRNKNPQWRDSEDCVVKYHVARAEAQRKANESGCDYGLEANDLYKEWHSFMLTHVDYRRGYELRCERVMCENITKCQPGHGPMVTPPSGWQP